MIVAALATWISFVLQSPGKRRIRSIRLLSLGLRLLIQSVVAGFDVARRALDPRLPLNPGVIRYDAASPLGPVRAVFSAMIGLVPGTVSVGPAADGALLVHCLDLAQPVAANLRRDETALLSVLDRRHADV
jgi:multicomponent Na+:H+ antiporter subunit E